MVNKCVFILFMWFSTAIGQSPIFESEPGYIRISADTTTVPIYVDGILMGHTPISNPIRT